MKLIERDVPSRELSEAWRQGAESGRLVLVCGEAEIGKTALVQQFVRQHPRQTRHFWGACDALFTPRPLGPLHDTAPHLGHELPVQLRDGTNRPAIFTAFLQSLQQQTTLAVIEDIHLADEATLDLLKYVGRRIHLTRSMLLVTYRDDELGARHSLRLLLGDLAWKWLNEALEGLQKSGSLQRLPAAYAARAEAAWLRGDEEDVRREAQKSIR